MSFGFGDASLIMLGLLLMALPGFLLVKFKAVNPDSIPAVAKIILYCSQPFLMISIFDDASFSGSDLVNIGVVFAVAFAFYIVFTLTLPLIFKFIKNDKTRRSLAFGSIYGNVGFMGIPVVKALLPGNTTALVYVAFIMLVFNICAYVLGVWAITEDKKNISPVKIFLNPVMLGVYVGATLFFTGVKLPPFLASATQSLGSFCIPVSMVMLGMRFATVKFSEIVKNWYCHIAMLLKLLIFPLLIYAVLLPFNVDPMVKLTLVITFAMPTASIALMFSEAYDQDGKSVSQLMVEASILSAVTVPLLTMLF